MNSKTKLAVGVLTALAMLVLTFVLPEEVHYGTRSWLSFR